MSQKYYRKEKLLALILLFNFILCIFNSFTVKAKAAESPEVPGISLQYKCGSLDDRYQSIRPYIIIKNNTEDSINFSDIKVRYYYLKEGTAEEALLCFYTAISSSCIKADFHPEKGYAEVSFSEAAGSIAKGSNSGQLQISFKKVTNGYYDQSNDYSYDPKITDYTDYKKMTLYYKGELVWGEEGPLPPAAPKPPPDGDDWLHVEGNLIKDMKGNTVHLTGINWFGFETDGANGFYGLNKCNLEESLNLIAKRGFNLLRLPISAEIIKDWKNGKFVNTSFVNSFENPRLDGLNSLEILDYAVAHCRQIGLKIMFDMHGASKDGYQDPLWYDKKITMEDFIASWEWITERYKNDDTVVAMDLKNEPHGKYSGPNVAKWDDSDDPNNWKKAAEDIAEAVLAINPNLLIVVEGVEAYPKEGYDYSNCGEFTTYCNWWGSNLRGVAEHPVKISSQNKLVYSVHEYGPDIYMQPWFKKEFDKTTLYNETWYPNWYYIVDKGIAPLLIGEWGGKLEKATNAKWLNCIAEFIGEKQLNHTFWSFNPNSADTGGLMLEDWKTVDEDKYKIIKQTLWMKGLDHTVPLGGLGPDNITKVSGYISPDFDTGNPQSASKAGFRVEAADLSISTETDETGYFELSLYKGIPSCTLNITKEGYLFREIKDVDLSNPAKGGVEISTAASPVELWAGDLEKDNSINIKDIMIIAQSFNTAKGKNEYSEICDINLDNAVNIHDIILVAAHFNKTPGDYK